MVWKGKFLEGGQILYPNFLQDDHTSNQFCNQFFLCRKWRISFTKINGWVRIWSVGPSIANQSFLRWIKSKKNIERTHLLVDQTVFLNFKKLFLWRNRPKRESIADRRIDAWPNALIESLKRDYKSISMGGLDKRWLSLSYTKTKIFGIRQKTSSLQPDTGWIQSDTGLEIFTFSLG